MPSTPLMNIPRRIMSSQRRSVAQNTLSSLWGGGEDGGSDVLVMPSPEVSAREYFYHYPNNQLGLEDSTSPKTTELVP